MHPADAPGVAVPGLRLGACVLAAGPNPRKKRRQAIPQPVFEVKGQDREATISILDPLFQYMLRWHPEAIITGGRT